MARNSASGGAPAADRLPVPDAPLLGAAGAVDDLHSEPGEDWWWCYPDDRLYEEPGATVGGTAT